MDDGLNEDGANLAQLGLADQLEAQQAVIASASEAIHRAA